MPMDDVGRLLDTLDEGYAEATGEQPAVPAHDPGTEVIPGTGTYHRPAQTAPQPVAQPAEERPAVALSPNDVLVARGTPPARQDKLVASYTDPPPTAPRDPAPYGDRTAPREPAYGETVAHRETPYGETYGETAHRDTVYGETTVPRDTTPAYGERSPFTGPQYVDTTGPQQRYTGDPYSGPQYTGDPYSGPQYSGDPYSGPQQTGGDLFTGPQYSGDPYSGPHGVQQQPEPFTGPQYVDTDLYQMPVADQRRPSPNTDPLGFPSQAAEPYQQQYPSDPYGGGYQQPQPQQPQSSAGLGTPMHGIPGAGRPRSMPQRRQPASPAHDDYPSHQGVQPNPVDPLLAMGRQEQYQQPDDPSMSRPYVGDPMFSTGERLRPEQQQPDYHERSDRREW
ncbi:hypothetical protein [Nonomuraea jiangxiensis]|nr:hypothetical protein [Nonomuraea jiangxiensis]